jgi:histidine triad (HIT) family protein
MASIFTRIIRGEIPCHRVHEDAHVLAFLDIAPLAPGHVLLVPRQEVEFLHQLDDAHAAALGAALPRVARAMLAATGATAYNLLQNNGALAHQAVPHVHMHLIPRFEDGRGLGIGWRAGSLDHDEAAALAARMRELVA